MRIAFVFTILALASPSLALDLHGLPPCTKSDIADETTDRLIYITKKDASSDDSLKVFADGVAKHKHSPSQVACVVGPSPSGDRTSVLEELRMNHAEGPTAVYRWAGSLQAFLKYSGGDDKAGPEFQGSENPAKILADGDALPWFDLLARTGPQLVARQLFTSFDGQNPAYFAAATFGKKALPKVDVVFSPGEDCERPIRAGDFVKTVTTTTSLKTNAVVGQQSEHFSARVLVANENGMLPAMASAVIGRCPGDVLEVSTGPELAYGSSPPPGLDPDSALSIEIEIEAAHANLDWETRQREEAERKERQDREAREAAERVASAADAREAGIARAEAAAKAGDAPLISGVATESAAGEDSAMRAIAGEYTTVRFSGNAVSDKDIASYVRDGRRCDTSGFERFNFVDGEEISVEFQEPGTYVLCYKHWLGPDHDIFEQGGWTEYPQFKITVVAK